MTDLPVKIRGLQDGDHGFILDSWITTITYKSDVYFMVPHKVLKSEYRAIIKELLEHNPDLFHVAYNEADPDQLYGWSCGESDCLHFVYVKKDLRGFGLTEMLCEDIHTAIVSSWTRDCKATMTYEPGRLREAVRDAKRGTYETS